MEHTETESPLVERALKHREFLEKAVKKELLSLVAAELWIMCEVLAAWISREHSDQLESILENSEILQEIFNSLMNLEYAKTKTTCPHKLS